MKKLDQELQKFKLELEADHAGITSKLEQVISSKDSSGGGANGAATSLANNTNLAGTLAASASGSFSKPDESDFTLSSSANLMMMMLNNSQSIANNNGTLDAPVPTNVHSSAHKRKHSNLSDKNNPNFNRHARFLLIIFFILICFAVKYTRTFDKI